MNFQPKKPLLTLSDFVTQLEAETSTFQTSDAIEIVEYNNFLKQPLTKEMFVGEEKIFLDYCNFARKKSISYGVKINNFYMYCMDCCWTIQDLAELSKKEGFKIYIKA